MALIGHSEGALSAPVLAAEEPVAAVVLMAGPGAACRGPAHRTALGQPPGLRRAARGARVLRAELDRFLAAIAQGEPLAAESVPPEFAPFLPARAWLASHLGRDPLPFVTALRCPILIAQGGSDTNVSAERDAPVLVAALDAAGHAGPRADALPRASTTSSSGPADPPSELDYLKRRPVDPEFLDELVAWLRARLME